MDGSIFIKKLLDKVLSGDDVTVNEANMLIKPDLTDLNELIQASATISRHYLKEMEMCAIYPAKIGNCSGDCAFCAQSAHHNSKVIPLSLQELDDNKVLEKAKELNRLGVKRFSLVTSGEQLTNEEFDRILDVFQRLNNETKIGLCASLGSLTLKRAIKLKESGVSRYHHNIETSRSFFPRICSTHSYDDKLETIKIARQAGLEICCGGIISMGESPKQRIEMAFALKELDVDCIPINILIPIPGTPLEKQQPLSIEEILRSIAIFRFILKDKPLRLAGGREQALGEYEYLAYTAGINALLVGDCLTTAGKSIEKEKCMLFNKNQKHHSCSSSEK